MPVSSRAAYDGNFNCSAECWTIFGDLIGHEFSDPTFGRVHQLSVHSYALQHAGGPHPDKSIVIHLAGLYAAVVFGWSPMQTTGLLRRIAGRRSEWPHFPAPRSSGPLTAFDVALASSAVEHVRRVKKWSKLVWEAWSPHHDEIAHLVRQHGGERVIPGHRYERRKLATDRRWN